jgi:hypothetical protein
LVEEQESHSVIRRILPFTTVGVILAVIYVGYVFYSRWSENREAQEKARQHEVTEAQKTIDAYGGGHVKVLNFTIGPSVVHRGEKVTICYGVSNAKTVSIDPKPQGDTWPSLSRCVEAFPTNDTTYTITAKNEKGETDTQSLSIKIQ